MASAAGSGEHRLSGRERNRVGCYPGSFNPPTIAHLAIAEAAYRQCGLDRLDLVVSRVALGKAAPAGPRFEDRIAVLDTIARTRPWLGVRVTDAQLLVDVAAGYDVLVLGADKWAQVVDPAWYDGSIAARRCAGAPARGRRGAASAVAGPHGRGLVLDEAHLPVSATGARTVEPGWMAAEAAAFDARTGAWTDPERYRRGWSRDALGTGHPRRVEVEQLDGRRAVTQPGEEALLLLGPGPARGEHVVEGARRDDHDAVGIANHPVARPHGDVADAHGPADLAPASFTAPRSAMQLLKTGKPWWRSASTSRTPASITMPARPRASAAVVSTSPQYPRSGIPSTCTTSALPAGAVTTPTWMARLSPGGHCTVNAGAASRAPGQAARTRGLMGSPPDSPRVAAPSPERSSATVTAGRSRP